MILAHETFEGTFPFTPHFSNAPRFKMHYVDEGSGATILCLHGEPTWSYLFRKMIPVLAQTHRVVALDHMGFGKSETPPDRTYWLQDHIDNLEKFALALDLCDVTLVMHDFGGPAGMGFAIRHPDRVKRIISVNGPTPLGQPDLVERVRANVKVSPWFQWILKAHAAGTLEHVLSELDYSILSTLKLNGFERNELITDTWLAAYRAPFPTPEESVGAIGWAKGYATGAHRFESPDSLAKATLSAKPALAIWGKADRTLHAEHFLPLFATAFPNGLTQQLPGVGYYSPEDEPVVIASLIDQFIRLT